jgi:hypothetical protein
LYAKVSLANPDGTPATVSSGVYNHHVVLADAHKIPLGFVACPGAKAGGSMPISIFASAGEEGGEFHYTTGDPDFSGGYYIPNGDRIFLTTEVVNYNDQPKTIFAVLDMEYIPGRTKYEVSTESISVTQCDGTGTGIKPQPGQKKFEATSKEMTIQMDGFIFGSSKEKGLQKERLRLTPKQEVIFTMGAIT